LFYERPDEPLAADGPAPVPASEPGSEALAPPPGHGEQAMPPAVVECLDRLCEGLARLEDPADADQAEALELLEDCLSFLQSEAAAAARSGAVHACRTMARMCALGGRMRALPDDRFFELAYAFCGVYVEAGDSVSDPGVQNWTAECEAYLGALPPAEPTEPAEPAEPLTAPAAPAAPDAGEAPSWPELPVADELPLVPVAEQPAPAPEAPAPQQLGLTPDGEPALPAMDGGPAQTIAAAPEAAQTGEGAPPSAEDPTDLLRTAQQLMLEGHAGDAKLLVLQAAAGIARNQVVEARNRVSNAEVRLREGTTAIEAARGTVRHAEGAVQEAEQQVAESRELLGERSTVVAGTEQDINGIDGEIASLEEQIRALVARRDAEVAHRAEVAARLELERAARGDAETRLDQARNDEDAARLRLEDARQQVKDLQRRRTEVESALERARDILTRQMASSADIETTIEQIRQAEPSPADAPDGFLF